MSRRTGRAPARNGRDPAAERGCGGRAVADLGGGTRPDASAPPGAPRHPVTATLW
ncbi:hypothetical protein [Streptomyces sp. SAI-129]|uniref:hypothetical protein n=1 Tax=Streptomyces sp. SAI-129 TaxID=3377727 RepID=UPI003C7BE503